MGIVERFTPFVRVVGGSEGDTEPGLAVEGRCSRALLRVVESSVYVHVPIDDPIVISGDVSVRPVLGEGPSLHQLVPPF